MSNRGSNTQGDTVFVLGGTASGKSAFAENLLADVSPRTYLASAQTRDVEMQARVQRHRQRRGEGWYTVEEPLQIVAALETELNAGRGVLLDCLTLWLSNLMENGADIDAHTRTLVECLANVPPGLRVVVVSNEVGMGIVPNNALARSFRDHAGRLNQAVAGACERSYFVVAGQPIILRGA